MSKGLLLKLAADIDRALIDNRKGKRGVLCEVAALVCSIFVL